MQTFSRPQHRPPELERIDPVELQILQLFFGGIAIIDIAPVEFCVIERSITTTGFYSIIKLKKNLTNIIESEKIAEFSHASLEQPGTAICWIDPDSTMCLEAVSSISTWPQTLLPKELRCSDNHQDQPVTIPHKLASTLSAPQSR